MTDALLRAADMYEKRVAAAGAAGLVTGEDTAGVLGMVLSGLDLGDPKVLIRVIHANALASAKMSAQAGMSVREALCSAAVMGFTLGALTAHAAQEET